VAIDVAPATQAAGIVWQGSDQLRLKFSGAIVLDKSDDEAVELFEALTPNLELEIRAAVIVSGAGLSWTRGPEGDVKGVIAHKTLSVQSVWPSD
jgi:hypothetical protein